MATRPLHTTDRATLRERLIALPQDAVVLPDGASFKANLDPFSITTDEECQSLLELCRIVVIKAAQSQTSRLEAKHNK